MKFGVPPVSSTALGKEEHKRLNQIVQQLIDSPDSVEFRNPVDYKALNLHDYTDIIKKPIDLGTVSYKLNNQEYRTVEECLEDIQLIWDNCKLYNGTNSWISKLAEKLERSFKKHVKNYLPLVNLPQATSRLAQTSDVFQEDTHDFVSYNDKVEFANNLKQLKPDQVGLIVHMLQNTSPNAFVELEQDKFQIIVDNIEPDSFAKINKQMETWQVGDESQKKVRL